jgi:cytochrome c biogenesis protein CcdA
MSFFLISIFAGILTVLAPCIFPFLPVVIGASEPGERYISRKALIVIISLSISVILFTILLKATTLLITIPQTFWNIFSGSIIILVGIALLFPLLWGSIPFVQRISSLSNKALNKGVDKKSYTGDVLIGLALGPVFTTCSPTYLFIIATILPAGFLIGTFYLMGFTLGLALSLTIIAYFGQTLVSKIAKRMGTAGTIKKIFAIIIILVGLAIMTGTDKKIETFILNSGYEATIAFEERLIEKFKPKNDSSFNQLTTANIPSNLKQVFSKTNWNLANPDIAKALSGGVGKDGIPSIDIPKFVSIDTFKHSETIKAIVMKDKDKVKVYPYNILTWHEIVNDVVDDVPVAITFCPLCGSAIVYNRQVNGDTLTFGVSGFLLESNMIMFDREQESLWQQSTGRVLAGRELDIELELVSFQLMSIGEAKKLYPTALVLSEDTGHRRNYGRNPYAGYEEEEDGFVFSPSEQNSMYPSKSIFVVFRIEDKVVGVPYLTLLDGTKYTKKIGEDTITIQRDGDLISISNQMEQEFPFYFEMWFSFYIQNQENLIIFDPTLEAKAN